MERVLYNPQTDSKPSEGIEATSTEFSASSKNAQDVNVLNGMLSGIEFDFVSMVIDPSTTETYTFKTGGSGGTTVATITIVYQSSSREDISTVTKS